MGKFCAVFGDHQLGELTADDVMDFLNQVTDGCKPQTKRIRYAHLSAFFNFIQDNLDHDLSNPCDSPMLRKLFRPKVKVQWNILEKDTVDEIIFKTATLRDRLLLELMARGAMRIGEVLKLTPNDIADRKLLLREPKSGRDAEIVFIPQKVADRLREYVRSEKIGLNSRIFPICGQKGG
jgi:integrase